MDNVQQIDFSKFVPQVHFEQIPINNLVSNQEYQRSVYMKHVARAAEHFDLYQINPVKVSRRNGINYVFNGQHTIEIVALVSGSRETPVWCMVYDDLVYEHEADIFANQMKYVKTLTPYEIFVANIEAGNEKQLLIRDLVVHKLFNIHSVCRSCKLRSDHVLNLLAATWEGATDSFSSSMLNGVAKLLTAYGNEIKDDIFKEKLCTVSLKEITRSARERHSGALGYAETMVLYYNKKNRYPLHWDKLYDRKKGARKKDKEPSESFPALTPPEAESAKSYPSSENYE